MARFTETSTGASSRRCTSSARRRASTLRAKFFGDVYKAVDRDIEELWEEEGKQASCWVVMANFARQIGGNGAKWLMKTWMKTLRKVKARMRPRIEICCEDQGL